MNSLVHEIKIHEVDAGVMISGHVVINLRFADNIARMLQKTNAYCRQCQWRRWRKYDDGRAINIDKTEVQLVSKNSLTWIDKLIKKANAKNNMPSLRCVEAVEQ